MEERLESLCIFTHYGRTYTFREVRIGTNNETVLVFTYNAMSDGFSKVMTVYKNQIVGYSKTHEG